MKSESRLVVARRQEGIIENDYIWVELVECSGAMEIGSVQHSKKFYHFFSLNIDISVQSIDVIHPLCEWHTPRSLLPLFCLVFLS